MNKELLAVAKGNKPADLVLKNGKIVNVYSGKIYEGDVAACGDTIAAVGDVAYCIGENTRIIDAQGNFITPGFLDGHIHHRKLFYVCQQLCRSCSGSWYYRYYDRLP